MKQKIIISSEELRKRALVVIQALPLEPVLEVVIREYKKDRSSSQNALYWQWLTIIGNELGETKEELHEQYKGKFLVSIYERDDLDYAEMLQTLRDVYREGMRDKALSLRKKIVALTSTTTATVVQMTEYLQAIDHDAASMSIYLPHPDDY